MNQDFREYWSGRWRLLRKYLSRIPKKSDVDAIKRSHALAWQHGWENGYNYGLDESDITVAHWNRVMDARIGSYVETIYGLRLSCERLEKLNASRRVRMDYLSKKLLEYVGDDGGDRKDEQA